MKALTIALIVIGIAMLGGLPIVEGKTYTEEFQVTEASIGEPVKVLNFIFTVLGTDEKPAESGKYFTVEIKLENVSRKLDCKNRLELKLYDLEDREFSWIESEPDDRWCVQPGLTLNGKITYNVATETVYELHILPWIGFSTDPPGYEIGIVKLTGIAPIPQTLSGSEPRLINQMGTELSQITHGDMVGIESEVANNSATKMTCSYIVQVRDKDGVTVFLTWVQNMSILPDDSVKPAVFWLSDGNGEYHTEVFIWQSIVNPIPLAPIKSLSFTVT